MFFFGNGNINSNSEKANIWSHLKSIHGDNVTLDNIAWKVHRKWRDGYGKYTERFCTGDQVLFAHVYTTSTKYWQVFLDNFLCLKDSHACTAVEGKNL